MAQLATLLTSLITLFWCVWTVSTSVIQAQISSHYSRNVYGICYWEFDDLDFLQWDWLSTVKMYGLWNTSVCLYWTKPQPKCPAHMWFGNVNSEPPLNGEKDQLPLIQLAYKQRSHLNGEISMNLISTCLCTFCSLPAFLCAVSGRDDALGGRSTTYSSTRSTSKRPQTYMNSLLMRVQITVCYCELQVVGSTLMVDALG